MINQFEDLDLYLKLCILVAGREVGAPKASTAKASVYICRYAYNNIHISETQGARYMYLAGLAETTGPDKGNTR